MVRLRFPRLSNRALILLAVIVVVVILILYQLGVGTDEGRIGARSADLHSGPYASVGFEFDWETGAAPDATPVSRMLDFAHRYTGKLTYSDTIGGEFAASGADCYTDDQAISISQAHRGQHTIPLVSLWVHVTVLDAYNCASKFIAGETYAASEIVIFMPTLRVCGLLSTCTADQVAEAAAISHEFGHVMGLCAIAMPDLSPPVCDKTGHALDKNSLMAPGLNLDSYYVQNLVLQPGEVQLLNELSWP